MTAYRGLIKQEDIEEVRSRVDIVQIISRHFPLKKTGRLFLGLCPFHKERKPSFIVNPAMQLFHCFGCGAKGTVFNFVMRMNGMEFPEAVKFLADSVGYQLHYEELSPQEQEIFRKKTKLYELNEMAMEFYHRQLLSSEEGKPALEYLKGRNFSEETIKKFKIGYSPRKGDAFLQHAKKNDASEEDLLKIRLISRSERGERLYDYFRGRLIFPIWDEQSRVVGFGGRTMTDEIPKYLNTPETPLYHKSKLLYGLNFSRNEIISSGEVVLVEGYTDTMALFQNGIKNVAATMGTALSPDHFHLLGRFSRKLILLFDPDVAGKTATERGLSMMTEFYIAPEYKGLMDIIDRRGIDVYVAQLKEGKDPADFVEENGAEKLREKLEGSTPLIDFCLQQIATRYDLSQTPQKTKAIKEMLSSIINIPSPVAQESYLRKIADILEVSYESVFSELDRMKKLSRKEEMPEREERAPERLSPEQKLEKELLRFILQAGEGGIELVEKIDDQIFSFSPYRELFSVLKSKNLGNIYNDASIIIDELTGNELLDVFVELTTKELDNSSKIYGEELFKKCKILLLDREIAGLNKLLNQEKDEKKNKEIFKKILKLESEKKNLRKRK